MLVETRLYVRNKHISSLLKIRLTSIVTSCLINRFLKLFIVAKKRHGLCCEMSKLRAYILLNISCPCQSTSRGQPVPDVDTFKNPMTGENLNNWRSRTNRLILGKARYEGHVLRSREATSHDA